MFMSFTSLTSICICIYFSSQTSLQNDIGHVIKGKFAGKRRRERERAREKERRKAHNNIRMIYH
jgi:hypothetical protein